MHSLHFTSGHSGSAWGRTILTVLVVCAYFAPAPNKVPKTPELQAAHHPEPVDLREPSRTPQGELAEAPADPPTPSEPAPASQPSRNNELLPSPSTPEEHPALAREPQDALKRAGCDKNQSHDVLGVSRVIDIDTTGGPWFGGPHGNRELLAPGEVVLTFDDGPRPHSTRAILAALAAQCTSATFFMVGDMAAKYPDVVRDVAEQGHTIGTHTWSHLNVKRLPEDKMKQQIEAAITEVGKVAGMPVAPFFRYPYLSSSKATIAYLQSRNVAQFAIDIDSLDWRSRNPPSIIHRVMSKLENRGGGIILLHDTYPSTAAAVPLLLKELKAKGYNIVHLRPRAAVQMLAGFNPPVTHVVHPHNGHGRSGSRSRLMMW